MSPTPTPEPYGHPAIGATARPEESFTGMRSSGTDDPPTLGAPIAVPGRNCWKRPIAGKVSFLVDGDAYFSAFAAAVERAQFSVLILGWDIDSRLQLRKSGSKGQFPNELGLFLKEVLSRRKKLQIHVLNWDFAMIYLLEREFLPVFKRPWRGHRRVHFRLDGHHPSGGSHHQKVVVIDCGSPDPHRLLRSRGDPAGPAGRVLVRCVLGHDLYRRRNDPGGNHCLSIRPVPDRRLAPEKI